MSRILFLFCLLFIQVVASAQRVSPLETLGDAAWEKGDWYTAHAFYEQAYFKDTTEFDITVKYAESLRMVKEYDEAAYFYAFG